MKSFLFLIPAAVATAILAGTTTGAPQEMEVNAGAEIKIPCSLKGVRLSWYWVPHYPICAGIRLIPKEIFLMISSSTSTNGKVDRFQKPSYLPPQEMKGNFSLTVQFHHMNDSGIFYCSNGKDTSSEISVAVKSDDQSGMKVETSKDSQKGKERVTLICQSCKKSAARTDESTITTWTLNGKKASVFRELKNRIIVEKSPQNDGLWKCRHPTCPMEFDGYCLENKFRTSKKPEIEETSGTTSTPLNTTKEFNIQIIGGSVIGLLTVLWIGGIIFALWKKLQARRISSSKTAKESKSQEIQNSVGVEQHPKKQGKEKDVEMDEGAEGIQYSVLQFKELEQCQGQKDKGVPAVIYAETLASNCSRS
ncbi:uncharacterized protein PHA67_005771 [Liasis olivaceus]